MMSVLATILLRVYDTIKDESLLHLRGLKHAYMLPVLEWEDAESQQYLMTRIRLRNYLKELNFYSTTT